MSSKNSRTLFFAAAGASLVIFAALIALSLASVKINFILVIFFALLPLFLIKPEIFLIFLFLFTPSVRIISTNETILAGTALNFNAVISLSILFFGLIIVLKKRREISKLILSSRFVKFFIAFLLLVLSSLAYSIDRNSSFEELIRITGLFLLFLYSYAAIKDKKFFKALVLSMIAGAIIPALIGLYQLINHSGWWDKTIGLYRIQGTFLHPATFSFYLLLIIPIVWAYWASLNKSGNKLLKILLLALAAFFLFLVIASLTRGAWVGLLAMIFIYGVFKNRRFLIAAGVFLVIAYLAVPAIQSRVDDVINPKYNSSFVIRQRIVDTTLPAAFKSPAYGYGFGTFETIHDRYNEEAHTYESLQAHNDYLRILIELGMIGLILYISLFSSLYLKVHELIGKTRDIENKIYLFSLIIVWAGALAISFGDNILRTMEVQYLLWAYTGAVLAFTAYNTSNSSSPLAK